MKNLRSCGSGNYIITVRLSRIIAADHGQNMSRVSPCSPSVSGIFYSPSLVFVSPLALYGPFHVALSVLP